VTIRIEVDRDLCIGAQNCVRLAPALFAIDDEGLAVVLSDGVPSMADARAAEHDCPTHAITVTDAGP
jgi:ferredoxin